MCSAWTDCFLSPTPQSVFPGAEGALAVLRWSSERRAIWPGGEAQTHLLPKPDVWRGALSSGQLAGGSQRKHALRLPGRGQALCEGRSPSRLPPRTASANA